MLDVYDYNEVIKKKNEKLNNLSIGMVNIYFFIYGVNNICKKE